MFEVKDLGFKSYNVNINHMGRSRDIPRDDDQMHVIDSTVKKIFGFNRYRLQLELCQFASM